MAATGGAIPAPGTSRAGGGPRYGSHRHEVALDVLPFTSTLSESRGGVTATLCDEMAGRSLVVTAVLGFLLSLACRPPLLALRGELRLMVLTGKLDRDTVRS